MKVLFWLAEETRSIAGGHQEQMRQTAKALRELGHEVDTSHDATASDVRQYDVVHGFNLSPEQVRGARQARRPVVLSTIWWPLSYRSGSEQPWTPIKSLTQARRGAGRVKRRLLHMDPATPWEAAPRLAFESSSILLPNSAMEAAAVRRDLGVTTPMMTVPNAVNTDVFYPDNAVAREDFILVVGRIEPHKNQLGTLEALRDQPRPVMLVGPPHPHHPAYYDQCRRALRAGDSIVEEIPHEELPRLYRRAAVHVLNTWFETTGLVSLEAAACGTPIVSTDRGFAIEYFEDGARYCDPGRPATVAEAVEHAIAQIRTDALSERVREQFTWSRAGARTDLAYRVAVGESEWSLLTESLGGRA